MPMPSVWQRLFLPAVTFMCIVIGGGYATGRELVEFFMPAGPVGGLLGMLVTAAIWSVIFSLSLELARATQSFEYRSFFRQLLGRGWIAFELVYLAILLLVLAVLGAAAGEMLRTSFGAPLWLGPLLLICAVAAVAALGSGVIEALFSFWGVLVYVSYSIFLIVSLASFSGAISTTLHSDHAIQAGWLRGGITYAGYNLAVLPAILFCARHQTRRREALLAGALAGPVAILPGILFYIAMLALYPQIRHSTIPVQTLLAALRHPALSAFTQVILFGTLIKTGIGVVHGFNERLLSAHPAASARQSRAARLLVAVLLSVTAMVLATRIGLVALISKGYGYIGWVVLAIYALPLLTIGVKRIMAAPSAPGG
jgi:uncharacterized membrane protein YkvI